MRSGISKNSLMFTTELFANKVCLQTTEMHSYVEIFVETVLPSVLGKTVYEKTFISKEAKNSVTNAIHSCSHFPHLLRILIHSGCKNTKNNRSLSEQAYAFLSEFISKAPIDLLFGSVRTDPVNCEQRELVRELLELLNEGVGSLPRIKKLATECVKGLQTRLKEESDLTFESFLRKVILPISGGEEAKE